MKDIRKEITSLSRDIGSVVSKANGILLICYYNNMESVKDVVTRFLSKNSLLECFVKIDFIECPKSTIRDESEESESRALREMKQRDAMLDEDYCESMGL